MPAVKCPIEGCSYETPDVGDAIVAALITAHCTIHASTTSATPTVEKVKRPTITSAGTSEEWSYFLTRWNEYANATKITGQDRVIQLLECCEESLRKDLTQTAGGSLLQKSEQDVLTGIKRLAVREENVMVARVTLHNMKQDRDETVRAFGARLRGQADICKFSIKCQSCDNDVNYTESILKDVLTRGIEDPEIQLDLLGNPKQDMSLEQVFQLVEAKESGKRSATTQDYSIIIHRMLQQVRIKETRINSLWKKQLTIQPCVLIVEGKDMDNMLLLMFGKINALPMTRHAIAVNEKITLKQFAGRKINRHLLKMMNRKRKVK